jgi:hypothetical protein
MKKSLTKQYTIRNIPSRVDRVLKQKAKQTGKSFNQVALEALISGTGESMRPERNFSEVIGSLDEKEAALIEEEIQRQNQIDPDLWK